jgi:ABC-2 type transport system ATP-binding protein
MIHVRKLVKYYGQRLAVDHIDLDVEKGRIVGILGPNGAGKTTTLRILTGFLPATAGSATIDGHDVMTDPIAVRRAIGYLPESNPLYPEMRVSEQLHHFGRLHAMSRSDRNRRIADLTESCGLSQIVHRTIGTLSKGNRQRVGLAQALLHDPPVLILDEPTEGLDPSQITGVRSLILDLGRSKTILLSSHILPEVEKTADDVVIIAAGRIVAQGSPQQLKARVRSASRVLMEVRADAPLVRTTLAALPQVADVTVRAVDGWTHAAITAKSAGQDIRELLGETAAKHHWTLREMRPETASLEEFFVQITAPAAADHDKPHASSNSPAAVAAS